MRVSYLFGFKIPVSCARETIRNRNDVSALELKKEGKNTKVGSIVIERVYPGSGNCIICVVLPNLLYKWRPAIKSLNTDT